jgi:uncharacterized membrane protein
MAVLTLFCENLLPVRHIAGGHRLAWRHGVHVPQIRDDLQDLVVGAVAGGHLRAGDTPSNHLEKRFVSRAIRHERNQARAPVAGRVERMALAAQPAVQRHAAADGLLVIEMWILAGITLRALFAVGFFLGGQIAADGKRHQSEYEQ